VGSVEWQSLRADELRELASADALVLLPVASTEQHGPHLATGVDDILCTEVCRRAALQLSGTGRPVVVAPTLWVGLAEHHMAFGGSFTLTLSTYHAVLRDLCRSITRAGFRRVLIVNGHGGNMTALNALTTELTRELEAPIAVTTYFTLAEAAIAEILEDQKGVMHACEAETSMMMAVRPDLVTTDRLDQATGPTASDARAILSPTLHRWRSFKEMSPSGVFGDARRATSEKGERLLTAVADALASRIAAGEPWD
jgi:creatinine amidohydrolase